MAAMSQYDSESIPNWYDKRAKSVQYSMDLYDSFYRKKIRRPTMSFQIDCESSFNNELPTLTIELIGHFSIDGNSKYQSDLSQLKYYIPPKNPNSVWYDLDKNYISTHHKPTSHNKLDNILTWIENNFNRLERPLSIQQESWLDVDFICRRGTLKSLLCSLYKNINDGWIICASKYQGTIYLCEYYPVEKEYKYVTAKDADKRYTSHGFKFEQYMLADDPSRKPNASVPLNECEEFHCMFKAQFGTHSLLYGAEIDGIISQEPITDNTLIGKKFELIELKTLRMFGRFNPNQIMSWWSQNYLAEINKVICGMKDGKIVKMIKEFPMHIIPKLSNNNVDCDLDRCKMFCKVFLDNVKQIVTKDHNECMYMFQYDSSAKYVINYSEEASNDAEYFFLKSDFVDKAEEYRKIANHHKRRKDVQKTSKQSKKLKTSQQSS